MSKVNLGGRPPFYTTVEDLQKGIDKYFEENTGIDYNENGEIDNVKAPTVSGLALYLGFSSRSSIYNYKSNDKFSDTIKKAITKIECFAEGQLFKSKSPTGAIFWLKNHGWYDKQELEHSGQIDSNNLTREELDQEIEELERKLGRK